MDAGPVRTPDRPAKAVLEKQVLELIEAGMYMLALKTYRELTGAGLKEARDYVDPRTPAALRLHAGMKLGEVEEVLGRVRAAAAVSSGCSPMSPGRPGRSLPAASGAAWSGRRRKENISWFSPEMNLRKFTRCRKG